MHREILNFTVAAESILLTENMDLNDATVNVSVGAQI
jgi:hypothetical protein